MQCLVNFFKAADGRMFFMSKCTDLRPHPPARNLTRCLCDWKKKPLNCKTFDICIMSIYLFSLFILLSEAMICAKDFFAKKNQLNWISRSKGTNYCINHSNFSFFLTSNNLHFPANDHNLAYPLWCITGLITGVVQIKRWL